MPHLPRHLTQPNRPTGSAPSHFVWALCIAALLAMIVAAPFAQAKTLRMAIADDATTMDPHAANILGNTRILNNIYEGLVTRDKDFKVVPALAVSWSQPDAKTWRFKLRPNVRFHDGAKYRKDKAHPRPRPALPLPAPGLRTGF